MWTIAAASVRGRGHEQTGTVCQDSSVVSLSPNGRWVALVASDGAGTAKYSDVGSRLVVDEVAKCLIRISEEIDLHAPGSWVSDRLIQSVVAIRERLRNLAGSDNISDYHCTLSAALVGPIGGLTIHLGDGAIFGGAAQQLADDKLDLAQGCFFSAPQNGEYANETYFLTERDWLKHLRIHTVSAVDWIVLGTDGGMSLAMAGEAKPKTGFVVPVIQALLDEAGFDSRCRALTEILDDRQADRLTNDDKTLVVAVREPFKKVIGDFGSAKTQGSSQSHLSLNDSPEKIGKNLDDQLGWPQPAGRNSAGDEAGNLKKPTVTRRNQRPRTWTRIFFGFASAIALFSLGALVCWQYMGAYRTTSIDRRAETPNAPPPKAAVSDNPSAPDGTTNFSNPSSHAADAKTSEAAPPNVPVSTASSPQGSTANSSPVRTPVAPPAMSDATTPKAVVSNSPSSAGGNSQGSKRPVAQPNKAQSDNESRR